MAKVDKHIIRARYTDTAHKHAYITLQGEAKPMMISEQDHPDLWHEMLTSVVLTHYQADAVATGTVPTTVATLPVPAPLPALAGPPVQALTVVQSPSQSVATLDPQTRQLIVSLEARVRELEQRPAGSHVDLDAIADSIAAALDAKLAELRRNTLDHEDRIQDMEKFILTLNEQLKSAAA
jgi:hypothetical protein